MSDRLIDAIRELDPCPDELPAPPIELVRRRLRDEPGGDSPAAPRWRPSIAGLVVTASSVVAIAVAVFALSVLGHAHRSGGAGGPQRGPVGATACRPRVLDGVLPAWARTGFSQPRPRMPYAMGQSGRIVAILWARLDSPPAADHTNKILWVSHVPTQLGGNLAIEAQRMVTTTRLGAPVRRSVTGGPGPSIINLPAPGCWRLTLRWSGWTDHIDLQYRRAG